MEKEIWRPYPPIEWVLGSNLGNMKTVDHKTKTKDGREQLVKGHDLNQHRYPTGYLFAPVSVNGKKVNLKPHRVIATCFLPNPNDLEQVNHKNAIRDDNRVENLEWCSALYNSRYRDKLGHTARHNKPKKPVIAVNLKTLEVLRFESQRESSRKLGINRGDIYRVLTGRYKQTHGYWFINVDENTTEVFRLKFGDSMADKVAKLLDDKELQSA